MMALRVISNAADAASVWDKRYSAQHVASPFCDFEFIESLAELFGWQTSTVVVGDVLAARLIVRSRGPLKDIVVPPFSPYSAILLNPKATATDRDAAVAVLNGSVVALPYSRLFSLDPDYFGADSSIEGFTVQERFTYALKNAPVEEAIAAWSSSSRRTFRKHSKEYEFLDDSVDVEEIAAMTAQGYKQSGRKMALNPFILSAFAESLIKRGLGAAVGLRNRDNGRLEAGMVLLLNSETAWCWLTGSIRGPSMTVLTAHVQQFLHARNVRSMDLMGANAPSIAEFKRRFGGDLITYCHLSRRSVLSGALEGLRGRPDVSRSPEIAASR